MTYFGFLLIFLVIPLSLLLAVAWVDSRRGRTSKDFLGGRAVWLAIGLHVLLALVYTTPWDNYLVATGVWYYNPQLISGILLGWVPLEEYTFFVLETILVGLWWWFLARRVKTDGTFIESRPIRLVSIAVLAVVWLLIAGVLISGWKPATYLALILVWALPVFMSQLAFGADILWHHRKLVLLTIVPLSVYLSATDSLAIASGTWTIDPAQTTGIMIGSLPFEEALFFTITVMIVSFGLTLSLSRISIRRWSAIMDRRASLPRFLTLNGSMENRELPD